MEINNLTKSRQQYDSDQRLHHICVLVNSPIQVMHGKPPVTVRAWEINHKCDPKHSNIAS